MWPNIILFKCINAYRKVLGILIYSDGFRWIYIFFMHVHSVIIHLYLSLCLDPRKFQHGMTIAEACMAPVLRSDPTISGVALHHGVPRWQLEASDHQTYPDVSVWNLAKLVLSSRKNMKTLGSILWTLHQEKRIVLVTKHLPFSVQGNLKKTMKLLCFRMVLTEFMRIIEKSCWILDSFRWVSRTVSCERIHAVSQGNPPIFEEQYDTRALVRFWILVDFNHMPLIWVYSGKILRPLGFTVEGWVCSFEC